MRRRDWNDKFCCAVFAHPERPCCAMVYIVARSREAGASVPQATRAAVLALLCSDDVVEIRVFSPMVEPVPPTVGDDQTQVFEHLGLEWLAQAARKTNAEIEFRHLRGERATLPYVREHARDLVRARQLIDGDFYSVLPLTAEFVVTLCCFHRCLQCSYRYQKVACGLWSCNDFSPEFHMAPESVPPLVEKLAVAGVKYLVVTGGGDPLVNPRATVAALEAAREKEMNAGLYSTLAEMSEDAGERIVATGPRFIRCSANAGDAEVHNAYCKPLSGRSTFESMQRNIEFFAARRARGEYQGEFGLSYLLNAVNVQHEDDPKNFATWVAEIAKRVTKQAGCRQPGIDFVRFTPALEYCGHTQLPQALVDHAAERVRRDAIPRLEDAGIVAVPFGSRLAGVAMPKRYAECLTSGWFAQVTPKGIAYNCCEQEFHPAFIIGDLTEQSIAEIWASEARMSVIQRVDRGCLRACPPWCKPGCLNEIAAQLKSLCATPEGKERAWRWLTELHELHNWPIDDPFLEKQRAVAF